MPFLQCRLEDLTAGDRGARRALTAFLGLPERACFDSRAGVVVDTWRNATSESLDWERTAQHDAAVDLMRRYGYSMEDLSDDSVRERYQFDVRRPENGPPTFW